MKMLDINLYATHQLIRKKYKIKTKLNFYKTIIKSNSAFWFVGMIIVKEVDDFQVNSTSSRILCSGKSASLLAEFN